MRYLPILLLAASTAIAQPITRAQQNAIDAQKARQQVEEKCRDEAAKVKLKHPGEVMDKQKEAHAKCMAKAGYK
jgi:hypothetical protein